MQKIYHSLSELVGGTPLLELHQIEQLFGLKAHLLVKLEALNPAGSAKDRIAKKMIEDAENAGLLKEGSVIIEPTSGNTGIGLAAVAAAKGYRVLIVMPDSMSKERCTLMTAYGAELVLTDGALGMPGAIDKANELAKQIENSFIPGQFVNPSNAKAHYETTGPEIFADTDGKVDIFVAGVGTGGTITGTGAYLKEKNPAVQVVAVEPKTSAVLSGGTAGKHGLQGIGAGWTRPIMTKSFPCRIATLWRPGGCSEKKRACWPESLQVRRSGLPLKWQNVRKMPEKPWWRCCPTPATVIFPHRCLPNKTTSFCALEIYKNAFDKLCSALCAELFCAKKAA